MTLFGLACAQLRHQPLATALTTALLAVGVGLIVCLLLLAHQFEKRMTRDLAGIDLVVGAKGSPLQLVLSSVYHVDVPTGNIRLADVDWLTRHPMVALTLPLALGDAVAGFRIVGSEPALVRHYGGRLARGQMWTQSMEAVLGSEVAHHTRLDVGDRFLGSHGVHGDGHVHDEHPYTVTGVLAPTGTTLDRLVVTAVASVHEVHEHNPVAGDEITALLIRYASPLAAVSLPRQINTETPYMAANPAFELTRLLRLADTAIDILRAGAAVLLVAGALVLWLALYSNLERTRYELAVLRVLGASRYTVTGFVLAQGLLLGLAGACAGLILGHGATEFAGLWLRSRHGVGVTGSVWIAMEIWPALLAVALATMASAPLAVRAHRMEISDVLAQGRR